MDTDSKQKDGFRLSQRVCKVSWREGEPFIEFGTVTSVTQRAFRVNHSAKSSSNWHATAAEAIDAEYLDLFRLHQAFVKAPKDWTVKDTVRCVVKVRTLEGRLRLHRRGING